MIRVKRGDVEGLCEPFQLEELKKHGWAVSTGVSAPVAPPPGNPATPPPPGTKTGSTPPPAK